MIGMAAAREYPQMPATVARFALSFKQQQHNKRMQHSLKYSCEQLLNGKEAD
jgi:hypothetical protein